MDVEPIKQYKPGHPMADKDGFIYKAPVNIEEEYVDMLEASRQYQNNVEVISTIKALMLKTANLESSKKWTEISKSSEQSLNNILNKLGVKTQDEAKKPGNKNSLGQEDFKKLMTTQLQNQDPFAPMDNGDFIAQMAQFSTVTGITEINNNLTNLGSKLEPNRVATAAIIFRTLCASTWAGSKSR